MLTIRRLEIMQHALGIPSRRPGYRNYYGTKAGDPELEEMVDAGMMVRGSCYNDGRDRYYSVHSDWKEALLQHHADRADVDSVESHHYEHVTLDDHYYRDNLSWMFAVIDSVPALRGVFNTGDWFHEFRHRLKALGARSDANCTVDEGVETLVALLDASSD